MLEAKSRGVNRQLFVLPTGAGKTVVFVYLQQALDTKALVLAHRDELLEQAAQKFYATNPKTLPQIEQGPRRARGSAQVIAASVQTLARGRRLDWFQPGLVIVDEAHHTPSPSYQAVLERFGCFRPDGPLLVGCTATPERLDKKNLGLTFEEQVFTMTPGEAVEDGWWCDLLAYTVKTETDISKVGSVAGDLNLGKLAKAVDVSERTREIIRHWREVAEDRATVVFCVNKQHARHFCEAFVAEGFRAAVLTEDEKKDRAAILKRFRSGQTQILCNVEVATEGFDHPGISCVVTARPTESTSLFTQMVGRGTRVQPGVLDGMNDATGAERRAAIAASAKPNCVVIDAADNAGKHEIATVPTILGLPRKLNLQGQSLGAAARLVKEIEARGQEDAQAALAFSDLETMLERVDLLSRVPGLPKEAQEGHCRLAWQKMGRDTFYINCGHGRDAILTKEPAGPWVLTMRVRGKIERRGPAPMRADARAAGVLFLCDRILRKRWPDALAHTG